MYEGSNFLVRILTDAADSGPGDSSILTFLTSPQIMAKLASLLFSTWQGFIYITIYFIMLIFMTKVLFDATILFLSAQIMLGLLISLAPIFIAFYLFESTKSFFENWLKQMIGYALQTVIVSAGILFMSLIIRNQIYNTLGFRVCLHEFPDMNVAGGGLASLAQGIDPDPGDGGPLISIFSWWFPHIPSAANAPALERILLPKAHFVSANTPTLGFGVGPQDLTPAAGHFCPAYECVGLRHPDLPFLDPNNEILTYNNYYYSYDLA
jgi:type IV secretion system protein VirB6